MEERSNKNPDAEIINENNEVENPILFAADYPLTSKKFGKALAEHERLSLPFWCKLIFNIAFALAIIEFAILDFSKFGFLLILLLLIPLSFFSSRLSGFLHIKNIKDINSETVPKCYMTATTNEICFDCGVTHQNFPLSLISAIVDKGDIYVIRFNKRNYLYIEKDAFTLGNATDFEMLLRSKMTPAKKKKSIRILNSVLSIFMLVTILISMASVVFLKVTDDSFLPEEAIQMSIKDLEELDDNNLDIALYYRLQDKIDKNQKLNKEQITYFAVTELTDCIYNANESEEYCYGLGDYLCDSYYEIKTMYAALDTIGCTDAKENIQRFLYTSNIEQNEFCEEANREKLMGKYPEIKKFNKEFYNNFYDDVNNKRMQYIRENIEILA